MSGLEQNGCVQLLSGSYHRRARDWMMGMKGGMEWMDGKCTLTQTTEARGHRCPAPPDAEAGAPSAMTHHREG